MTPGAHTIDVRVERKPDVIETSTYFLSRSNGIPSMSEQQRGPVRLVIDMPARTRRTLVVTLASTTFLIALMAWVFAGPGLFIHQSNGSLIVFLGAEGVLVLAGQAIMFGLGSRREVLEIDSRFVTVKRAEQVVAICSRRQVTDAWVNEPPATGFRSWSARHLMDWPWLMLGADGRAAAGAGAGLSRASAGRLVPAITEFLAEHPADPTFEWGMRAGLADAIVPQEAP